MGKNKDRVAKVDSPNNKPDDFGHWLKSDLLFSILVPLGVVAIISFISVALKQGSGAGFKVVLHELGPYLISNLITCLLELVLTFLLVSLPRYLLYKESLLKDSMANEFKNVKDEIKEDLTRSSDAIEKTGSNVNSKIDELPQLTAFHTVGKVFEERVDVFRELKGSSRWIYSKFISRLLHDTFESFTLYFPKTIAYSDFSSEVMRECSESVSLTSAMSPYEWLSLLAKDDNERTLFFNNVSKDLELNQRNHSMVLRELPNLKKRRIVCLSAFDYNHLFLFEQGFEKYMEINQGIDTVFCKWDSSSEDIDPLKYEYALYDGTLLFRFEKETRLLTVLKEGSEFDGVKNLFTINDHLIQAETIRNEIKSAKKELLSEIKENSYQIPHKFSYLFHDNWTQYTVESTRFGANARNAIANLIDSFDDKFYHGENIIEIGAGYGDKIDMVCDRIGTFKIATYELVDISRTLMREAINKLKKRFAVTTESIKEYEFDFCVNHSTEYGDILSNKTVLILNNSTIFTEYEFPWDKLKSCKKVFITLDLFDKDNKSHIFEEYLKARELMLSPLRIFGIPIVKELVNRNLKKPYRGLFSDSYVKDANYSNDNPYFRVYFDLKRYLRIIKTDYKIDVDASINDSCKELIDQDKIVVLSSLKFINDDNCEEKAKQYFEGIFGSEWCVIVKKEKNDEDSYIGILIEKKSKQGSRQMNSTMKP